MRHVILTCKNHLNLRWSCKEIAFSDAHGYDGSRQILFLGQTPGIRHDDGSGFTFFAADQECTCSPQDLIRAPEDAMVRVSPPEDRHAERFDGQS